jgi:hypothetical protein
MRYPHPIRNIKAKRAAKKLAEREALKAELQKELDHKTIAQIQDEATKARITKENERAAIEAHMAESAKDLDRAQSSFSRSLNRMTKSTGRMQTVMNWMLAGFWSFMVLSLGVTIGNEKSNFVDYASSLFFVVFFGLLLIARYWDLQHEAKQGRQAHLDRKEELEKRDEERKLEAARRKGREEAEESMRVNQTAPAPATCDKPCNKPCDKPAEDDDEDFGLADIADLILEDDDAPEELKRLAKALRVISRAEASGDIKTAHDAAMSEALQQVIDEVIDAKVEALGGRNSAKANNWHPGEEETAEVKRRFEKLTGHTVDLKFHLGRGWGYKISESGTKHADHKPGRSPAHDAAAERGDAAREEAHADAVDSAALAAETIKKKPSLRVKPKQGPSLRAKRVKKNKESK